MNDSAASRGLTWPSSGEYVPPLNPTSLIPVTTFRMPSVSSQSMFNRNFFWTGSNPLMVVSTFSVNAGKQYPPFFQPMSVPVVPFQWEKTSMLC